MRSIVNESKSSVSKKKDTKVKKKEQKSALMAAPVAAPEARTAAELPPPLRGTGNWGSPRSYATVQERSSCGGSSAAVPRSGRGGFAAVPPLWLLRRKAPELVVVKA
jgi:hypothetical protein